MSEERTDFLQKVVRKLASVHLSSVAQSCPTLCNPMDCSIPGFPAHHQLLKRSNSCPSSQWCHPVVSSSVIPFFSCLQFSPALGSSPISQFFSLGGQSIGASALASVLPMNIQGWFLLELTKTSLLYIKNKP